MKIITYLKKLRDDYLKNQVNKVNLPEFKDSPVLRKVLIFSGRVQNVGFRVETYQMAKRLGLSGFVRNREDRKVQAEVQGEEERINYLIGHLKSVGRINIEEVEMKDIPIAKDEREFVTDKLKL